MPDQHPQRVANREEAFGYWYNRGDRRSAREVAEHYGVGQRTVEQWVADEDWVARAQGLDAEARRLADRELVKAAARRLKLQTGAAELVLAEFVRGVQAGTITVDGSLALAWAKHVNLLDGGVTDRSVQVPREQDETRQRVILTVAEELAELTPEQLEAEAEIDP